MLVLAGFATGLVVGTTGVGGGALLTPLLLLVFGIAPTVAVGTDLWFAALTKLAATRLHHARGLIDWQVARRLWTGSLPASVLMLALISASLVKIEVQMLRLLIAVAVVITATGLFFHQHLHALGRRLRLADEKQFKRFQAPLTVLAGGGLGLIVTLTSVGAGALGAVMLTYLYPLRLTPSRLVATDIVHAIPLAVVSGTGHLLLGNVHFDLLGWLLLGSIPGVLLGASLSVRLPQTILRNILAAVLLLIGIQLWWKT